MKKLFCIILAITLVCAMSVTAFAAGGDDTITVVPGSKDIDVNAKYVDGSATPDVFSVDIEWGALEFTYSSAGTRVWDPATHTYTDNTTAGWAESGNTVKVTNHSNKGVAANFTFTKLGSITESITGSFEYNKVGTANIRYLLAGTEDSPSTADSVTATLTLSGVLASSRAAFEKVGTITVTLSSW